MSSVYELLQKGEAAAPALGSPGQPSMTYGQLRQLRDEVRSVLRGHMIEPSDRLALLMPNGPEMAAAFLALASSSAIAPLNPAYREEELTFYLQDLKPKCLILQSGASPEARAVAHALSLSVLDIHPLEGGASGLFQLGERGGGARSVGCDGGPKGEDIALLLHTSGTTSRPKLVPLSHTNLVASAAHIAETLKLSPVDRGLNIMPLFHIHGLIASLLSSISVGAHLVCTPGFNALKIYRWLKQVKPSWYTAVPTMHQAILERASRNQEIVDGLDLRFIRSSSASLPPSVMAALEEVFKAPVIEAYGMTEAAHQMASNGLPPAPRRPGSVGRAAGPEIAIMDEAGELLSAGMEGEVVICGRNVFRAYENNPEANEKAFTKGWFHTGDLGVLDDRGMLTLTGRLKEIINRGGEKIAPQEIDNVLQSHPAIAQVVVFALPHAKLGEEVGAAIVLNESHGEAELEALERELRAHALRSVAPFKVPRKFFFMDQIPVGATGKLQRIGLADKLRLNSPSEA